MEQTRFSLFNANNDIIGNEVSINKIATKNAIADFILFIHNLLILLLENRRAKITITLAY